MIILAILVVVLSAAVIACYMHMMACKSETNFYKNAYNDILKANHETIEQLEKLISINDKGIQHYISFNDILSSVLESIGRVEIKLDDKEEEE